MELSRYKTTPLKNSLTISLMIFLAAPFLLSTNILPYLFRESDIFHGVAQHRHFFVNLSSSVLFFVFPFLIAASQKLSQRLISSIGFASITLAWIVFFLERTGHIENHAVSFFFTAKFLFLTDMLYMVYLLLFAKESGSKIAAKLFSIPILLFIVQTIIHMIPKGHTELGSVSYHWIIASIVISAIRQLFTGGLSLHLLIKLLRNDSASVQTSSEQAVPAEVSTGIGTLHKLFLTQLIVLLVITLSMIFKDEWEQPESYLLISLMLPVFLFRQCAAILPIIKAKAAPFTKTAKTIFTSLILLSLLSLINLSIAPFLPSMEEINVLSALHAFFQFLPGMMLFYGVVNLLRKTALFANREDLKKRTTVLLFYPLITIVTAVPAAASAADPDLVLLFNIPAAGVALFLVVFFFKTMRLTAKIK